MSRFFSRCSLPLAERLLLLFSQAVRVSVSPPFLFLSAFASVQSGLSCSYCSLLNLSLCLSAFLVLSLLIVSTKSGYSAMTPSVRSVHYWFPVIPHPSQVIPSPIIVWQNCLSVYLFHSYSSSNLSRDVNRLLSLAANNLRALNAKASQETKNYTYAYHEN